MKKIVLIFLALFVLLAGSVAVWFYLHRNDLPVGIAMGNGRIEAQEIDIATRSGGRVEESLVQEGDLVKEGQIVVRMDMKDLRATRNGAEAKTRQAQSKLTEADADLAQTMANLDLATKEAERVEKLVGPGVISRSVYDKTINQKQISESAVAAAIQRQNMAGDAIIVAEADVMRLDELLTDEELKATRNGRVLYRLALPGEVLGTGGRAVTILDLTDVYMAIFLSTEQIGTLKIGDDAVIVLDALPNKPIPATISYIAPEAQFTPRQVETKTERDRLLFRVKIQIQPALLKKYMGYVRTGLSGVSYVRLNKDIAWPEKIAPNPTWLSEMNPDENAL